MGQEWSRIRRMTLKVRLIFLTLSILQRLIVYYLLSPVKLTTRVTINTISFKESLLDTKL